MLEKPEKHPSNLPNLHEVEVCAGVVDGHQLVEGEHQELLTQRGARCMRGGRSGVGCYGQGPSGMDASLGRPAKNQASDVEPAQHGGRRRRRRQRGGGDMGEAGRVGHGYLQIAPLKGALYAAA